MQNAEFKDQSAEFKVQNVFFHFSLCALIFALLVAGLTYSGWHRVRSRVIQADEYRFSATSVHVTETPSWVPATIVNDVISDFNIGRNSRETLIDSKLLKELDAAFRAYHWVESVERVQASFPATVTIDLIYRTPICMVLLPNEAGAYVVDRHGVYLAADYFVNNPQVDVNRYIKVLGVNSTPKGNIGEEWGDETVELAAALADHLNQDKGFLGIASIRVVTTGTNRYTRKHHFFLPTMYGTEIVWGEMPLAPGDTRKERLLELVRQHRSLEKAPRNTNNNMIELL
jgi:hypothetical protein